MEIKELIKMSQEKLEEVAQKVNDKVTDKEFQDKVIETSTKVVKETTILVKETSQIVADTTMKTIQKTKEYAEEKRIMPGAKDKYINELENELAKKEKEIARLKKQNKSNNWMNH